MNYKQFVDFVNKEFERLGITDFVATKADRTYHRTDDYESGACKMMVWFEPKNKPDNFPLKHYFMCDYFLKEYNEYLKNGHEMYLAFRFRSNSWSIKELEVRVRPITNPK